MRSAPLFEGVERSPQRYAAAGFAVPPPAGEAFLYTPPGYLSVSSACRIARTSTRISLRAPLAPTPGSDGGRVRVLE